MEITATINGKVKDEGSTIPVESHHTSTGAPSTSPSHLSSPPRISIRLETKVPQPSSPTHTYVADVAASICVDVRHEGAATTVTSLDAGQGSGNIDKTSSTPHDLPLLRVNTFRSDEDRMQHNELIDLVTKLSDRVLALEADLKQKKKVYGVAYTKLIMKVKKLEKIVKTSQDRRKAKIVVSDEEVDLEDPSKQGKKIEEIDQDPDISLIQHDADIYRRYEQDMDFDFVAAKEVNTLVYIRRSAAKIKDKGKGIMEEHESAMTKIKRQQEQEKLGHEAAVRLQEEFDEEEKQRISRVHEAA
uniref:Uncharacterized protein n=1 Tax=Tanacetum cinerariifolium TaxID=118510 RepID=A0A6L2J7P0_TANCI|nr:hypothetical protein [Tanacetum cinerariifolium]